MRSFVHLVIVSCIYFVGVAANTGDKTPTEKITLKDGRTVAAKAEFAKPLQSGQVPDVELIHSSGKTKSLRELVKEKPALVLFYRGGWCPYCNQHLKDIASIESQVAEKGYQIIAISPDSQEVTLERVKKEKKYTQYYSDSKMNASIAFGLAYQLPESLVATYKNKYDIDLEGASGETHHLLPVPAAYLVKKDGTLSFAHANPDYKVRISTEELLSKL